MTTLLPSTSSEIQTLRQLNAERDRYLSFLRRRIDSTTAEDILQSALLKVAERGIAPREDARLSSWFYSVLRNAATDYLRHRARGARVSAALLVEPAPADHDAPNECLEVTRSLVSHLSASDRETLETVYSEGGSITQLAERLAITRNAATVRVHRARAALAKLVETSCPSSSPCASAARYGARVPRMPRARRERTSCGNRAPRPRNG
jgi:RNA polymerase sigma-70 factor, ECF subfamily